MSSGKVGFWNFQLSIKDADKLLGETGMAEQREWELRQREQKTTYESRHSAREDELDR